MRNKIFSHGTSYDFRHRSKEIVRVEALSDAVFGFSISLLVASLEVPQTFDELKIIATGAIPFFPTVALLFLFWYQQYLFFRRYGLNDVKTILLNLAYLAIILFYVYPLKFLFSLLISSWSGINLFSKAKEKGLIVLANEDFPALIILFSAGYLLIWLIIYFMHKHALSMNKKLDLNNVEILITQKEVRGAIWNADIGLAALLMACMKYEILAGICYLFIPVVLLINHRIFKVNYAKLKKK